MFRRRPRPSRSSDSSSLVAAASVDEGRDARSSSSRASRRRAGMKRINECIQQLEQRYLLTTLQSTAGLPRTFEYIDGSGKTMRILMQGNIRAEFIAAEVPDNSSSGGTLPHIKLRPRDLI